MFIINKSQPNMVSRNMGPAGFWCKWWHQFLLLSLKEVGLGRTSGKLSRKWPYYDESNRKVSSNSRILLFYSISVFTIVWIAQWWLYAIERKVLEGKYDFLETFFMSEHLAANFPSYNRLSHIKIWNYISSNLKNINVQ